MSMNFLSKFQNQIRFKKGFFIRSYQTYQNKQLLKLYLQRFQAQQIVLFWKVAFGLVSVALLKQHLSFCSSDKEYSLHFSINRWLSRIGGRLSYIYIPNFARKSFYGYYVEKYNVDVSEMEQKVEDFTCFQQLFTRQIKERNIHQAALVSPVDAKVTQLIHIQPQQPLFQVKGVDYHLHTLLKGQTIQTEQEQEVDQYWEQKLKNGNCYLVEFKLEMGDYHRVHSPCELDVKYFRHIRGHFNNQNGLENERVVLLPKVDSTNYKQNKNIKNTQIDDIYPSAECLAMVLVGSVGCGSIKVHCLPDLQTNQKYVYNKDKIVSIRKEKEEIQLHKGEEVGMFNMGSTVLLLLQLTKQDTFLIKQGDRLQYGQPLIQHSNHNAHQQ